jgi:transposase
MKMVDAKKKAAKREFVDGVRVNKTGRRTFTPEYKLRVVQQCSGRGVSVAAIALEHRLNANLLRRWIVAHQRTLLPAKPKVPAAMLPVTIAATPALSPQREAKAQRRRSRTPTIEIEIDGAHIHLRGGVDAQALRIVLDLLARR